jgi:hypothetical protein
MLVARTSTIVVSVAAVAAVVVALAMTLRLFGSTIVKAFRNDDDHPHWELLMQ